MRSIDLVLSELGLTLEDAEVVSDKPWNSTGIYVYMKYREDGDHYFIDITKLKGIVDICITAREACGFRVYGQTVSMKSFNKFILSQTKLGKAL
jgi:hypothetical protein